MTYYGWHSLPADRRLTNGDGRQVVLGEKITVAIKPELCKAGLHWSATPRQMLQYIAGPVICYVRGGGEVLTGDDKLVGTERTVLWWADCSGGLREFACRCALDVAHLWEMPEVVRGYLIGEDRSESARIAARNAAAAAADAAYAAYAAAAAAAYAAAADARQEQSDRLARMLRDAGFPGEDHFKEQADAEG